MGQRLGAVPALALATWATTQTATNCPSCSTNWHRIAVDQTRAWDQTENRGQHRLFLDAAAGVREATAEKRETLPERIEAMLEILDSGPDEQWVIWCDLNREQDEIERC